MHIKTQDVIPVRGKYRCPDEGCGRQFAAAKALGSHRFRAHGIMGINATAKLAKTRGTRRRNPLGFREPTTVNTFSQPTAAREVSGVPLEKHVLYIFTRFQTLIEVYASTHALPAPVVAAEVGEMLKIAAEGRSQFRSLPLWP